MNNKDHPVWNVYDELRTARLNVKYYSAKLENLQRCNFLIEFILAATVPGSAIAGLYFWGETGLGAHVWKILGAISAILAVAKPFLKLADKIVAIEQVVSGYRGLDFDLSEIKMSIEQIQNYNKNLQAQFTKAFKRKRELVLQAPETKENKKLKKQCMEEVARELPVDSFFIPRKISNGPTTAARGDTKTHTDTRSGKKTPR